MDGLLGVGMMKLIVSQWIIPENSLRLASVSFIQTRPAIHFPHLGGVGGDICRWAAATCSVFGPFRVPFWRHASALVSWSVPSLLVFAQMLWMYQSHPISILDNLSNFRYVGKNSQNSSRLDHGSMSGNQTWLAGKCGKPPNYMSI